jgi:hypothetical protein
VATAAAAAAAVAERVAGKASPGEAATGSEAVASGVEGTGSEAVASGVEGTGSEVSAVAGMEAAVVEAAPVVEGRETAAMDTEVATEAVASVVVALEAEATGKSVGCTRMGTSRNTPPLAQAQRD